MECQGWLRWMDACNLPCFSKVHRLWLLESNTAWKGMVGKEVTLQTNKQTNKQPTNQTNKQTNKQINKHTNELGNK